MYLRRIEFIRRYGSFNYPKIDCTGSVKGMKKLGYWDKKDKCIRCGKYIYNVGKD